MPSDSTSNEHRSRQRTPYKCSFCDEYLREVTDEPHRFFSTLLLVGTFHCPHCFTRYRRPIVAVGRMPFVRKLFSLTFIRTETPSLVEQHQADLSNGGSPSLAKLGRWMNQMETNCVRGMMRLISYPGRLWRSVRPKRKRSQHQHASSRRSDTFLKKSFERRSRWRAFLKWLSGSDFH